MPERITRGRAPGPSFSMYYAMISKPAPVQYPQDSCLHRSLIAAIRETRTTTGCDLFLRKRVVRLHLLEIQGLPPRGTSVR